MATQQAFAIPELFDTIMLQLAMKQLFLNQRVCRRWHHNLKASKPLQKKMFRLPGQVTSDPKNIQLNLCVETILHQAKTPSDERYLRQGASWKSTLLFRPALKGVNLSVHIWGENGTRRLVDGVDGSGAWRSITMEAFLKRMQKEIETEKIEVEGAMRVTVSYVGRHPDELVQVTEMGVQIVEAEEEES